MLTDTERRRLQEQGLGELWHGYCDDVTRSGEYRMCLCGFAYILAENHINRTFTHAQDYEDLLKKVVRPNMAKFYTFISRIWVPKRWWPSVSLG